MKKILLIFLAFAVILMTNCRKNNVQPVNGGDEPFGDYEMTLTAGNGDGDKSSIEGLYIHWQLGDKLHVVDSNTMTYLGYLSAVEIGTPKINATFKGFITRPTAGHRCKFYFVGTNDFSIDGDGNYLFDVSEQYGGLSIYIGNAGNDDYEGGEWKGDFNDVSNGLQLMKNRNTITATQEILDAHNFGDIYMRSMMAISRLHFKVDGTSMGGELSDSVTVTGPGCIAQAKLNIQSGDLTPVTGQNTITLKKANDSYYMVLIPGTQETEGSKLTLMYSASSAGNEYTFIEPTVACNMFYNYSTAKPINMTGEIDFNDSDMSVSGLPIWLKKNLGATCSTNVSDPLAATTWYGDYYAWGEVAPYYTGINWSSATSGSAVGWKTNMTTGAGNTVLTSGYAWQSYSQGASSSFVEWNTHPYGSDNVLTSSYDAARQHASWGGFWRMPTGGTNGEWQRLYNSTLWVWTNSYMGITNLKGYVVYKVKATAHKGQCVSTTGNSGYTGYDGYTYALSDPHMFVPATGFSDGTGFSQVGSQGNYWSSSRNPDRFGYSWNMYFPSDRVDPLSSYFRCTGFTVRPVRTVR